MELRIELESADPADETALDDLLDLLRDEGIAVRYADSEDPNAMGADPIAIVNVVLATITTACAVMTLVVNMRSGRAGKVVAEDGSEAPIDGDAGKLGETLHGWFFAARGEVEEP